MVDPSEAASLMIERLKDKINKAEVELVGKKRLVNALAAEEGLPQVYQIVDDGGNSQGGFTIKSDQFHGLPLATAVRNVLETRVKGGNSERAATSEEIYTDLIRGGYDFDTKDRDKAIHGLKVSLGKNPAFRGVGQTGRFGLSEWYGGPRKRETKQTEASSDEAVAEKPENGPPMSPNDGLQKGGSDD